MRRRKLLALAGVGLVAPVAGCAGSDDEDGDDGSDGDSGDAAETASETETDTDTESEGSDDESDGDDDTDSDDGGGDEDTEEESVSENGDGEPVADGFEPVTVSGSGAEVVDDVEIADGLTVVEAAHTGSESNFIVEFVPSSGDFNTPFVNEIGEYEGETADLMDADTYQIDVDADGDWELTVRQPRAESGEELPQSLSDDTHAVFGPFEFDGTHTAAGEHTGDTNFIVQVFPPEGLFGEVVFNEVNEFEGETTFSHDGVGYVAVRGYGEWSVELE